MTEQGKNTDQDAFMLQMGPLVLEQAEKALAKVTMLHVARVATTKVLRSSKTVEIVRSEGHTMLIEFAQYVYGITPAQAEIVVDDAIEHARNMLRKAA